MSISEEEQAVADEALTLAINALRDIAESRRMPSGIQVSTEVAALHSGAADQLETVRRAVRADWEWQQNRSAKKGKQK